MLILFEILLAARVKKLVVVQNGKKKQLKVVQNGKKKQLKVMKKEQHS